MAEHEEFLRLFMPVQGDLLAYILGVGVSSSDADDVLQNAAVVMWRKFDTFELGTNFRAWAFAVVRHEVHKSFDRRSACALSLNDEAIADLEQLALEEEEPPRDHVKALLACLSELRSKARDLIEMRYRQRLSVGQMAQRLGRPVESLYTTLSRVRKTLGECIERFTRREASTP